MKELVEDLFRPSYGNIPTLLAATVVMASIVVTVNRLLWRRLYALASARFSMNA